MNYDKHATQFTKHFCRRGCSYSKAKLKAIFENVQKITGEEFLTYRKKDKSNRVTLVLPFHHKFRGIQEVLQTSYSKMITCNPDLKQIFADILMISFRQAPNIQDKVVRANHSGHKSYLPMLPPERKSYIADLINHSKTFTYTTSNQMCYIEEGNANTAGAIYSALCTELKTLHVFLFCFF